MLLFWSCVMLTAAAAHRVVESSEDVDPAPAHHNSTSTTTLYPVVANKTAPEKATKLKSATSWKIETTFGESKLDSNSTASKEELTVERPANSSQEFRASQHLGNFVDEDSFEIGPTRETPDSYAAVLKKPPTGFISSLKGKFPKQSFKHSHDFPYKLEAPILTRTRTKDGWKPTAGNDGTTGLEPTPTDESPVSLPAGGLYKLPVEPFKVKPGTTDEDFGLEFSSDGKEHHLRKRVPNPWSKLLHFLTALIPVGIIFSALTPSVITIEPDLPIPPNIFRRQDGSMAPPPMSEGCRRRLLCELHSETNYPNRSSGRRGKQCYRLKCEDPEGLERSLQWLLAHHQQPTSGHTGDHFT